MECPLVSVIIPNYNHARFLKERIKSVLTQTYQNFELIILDDKSTDNSIDIIKKYEDDPHISHFIINEENSGSPFSQWKKGFELAKGELIWIAESDDICEKELLETLVSEFNQDKDCVLAFCKSIKIDTEGNTIGKEGLTHSFHINGIIFIRKYLSRHNYIANASSVVFKKKVLNAIDPSFTEYRGCGDWILWIEISRCGKVAYNNIPMNYFRIHGNNTTTNQAFSGRNEIEGANVYVFMRKKKYIGYKEELRARISHIYSVTYGKQHTFYSKETRNEILKAWKVTPFIRFFTWTVHIIQSCSNMQIIRR